MKLSLLGVFGIWLVLVAAQCSNPFGPDQSMILPVEAIDAPSSIPSNQRLVATITLSVGGCQTFRRFQIDRASTQVRVAAWGHDPAKGRNNISCPQVIRSEEHIVRIDPPFNRTFTLVAVNPPPAASLSATVQVE